MPGVIQLLFAAALLAQSSLVSASDSTIVGGQEAPKFKYSNWTVGLLSKTGTRPFCGASYIGKNVVLTAAHCVDDLVSNPSRIRVEAGRHDWRDTSEKGIKMDVVEINVHPSYGSPAQANDIAILKVTGGADLRSYPELDDGSYSTESSARTFKILGWGATSEGGSTSPKLLQASVKLVTQSECQRLYGNPSSIHKTMICAKRPGVDTCQGDSGGPMIVDNAVPVLVGLTSWGEGCAREQPGVYSRVAILRSYVDKVLNCPSGTTFTGGKCQ